MSEKRQLRMRRDMMKPLPELLPMPDGFSVHSDDGTCAGAWEWIIEASFGTKYSYDMIRNDPSCAPERVFFVKEYSQDVGTAAVQMKTEGKAMLHMVGVHPVGGGRGIVKYAVRAALAYMAEHGVREATLLTDDFRLPAIRTYLEMGFEPIEEDEEMKERWQAVQEKLDGHQKQAMDVIRLWPENEIPYWEEGQCVPALDAYPVAGSKGAVVVCPGGGYCMKASHEGGQIAKMLNMAGISAYVLDYRVRPCHYEAPLSDAKRAIRTVRGMGYEKVAILGFSAGGHLTCSAATLYDAGDPAAEDPIERLSSRPDAFIPCYPVVSFASFRHQGSLEALLGDKKNDYSLIRRFSAELHVNGDTPPAFIWHTAEDGAVPVENSLNLAAALAHAGVSFELHIFPHGPHGMGLAGGDPVVGQWPALCQKWLLNQGYGVEEKG